ncbi:hypothetical protein [Thioclava sp. SK-1]|uniref:hypothetical protein n=1 Tax=Thioclava sp. SK-1 TaxID=1889770 RepID=UPI00159F10C0|nr:hypothetical protein [Thioclava sp. SK-1]
MLMRPALSVIDMIPNVHRTPALAGLRRAVLAGRTKSVRLSSDEKELAFYDAPVQLTSPIGARMLYDLYQDGRLKLKKTPQKSIPALEAYIATEAEFRTKVADITAADAARQSREAAILANPDCAQPHELTSRLIDRVMSRHLGHGVSGRMQIAGLDCHRFLRMGAAPEDGRSRAEEETLCWWYDDHGQCHGTPP